MTTLSFSTYQFRWSLRKKGKQIFNICQQVLLLGGFAAALVMGGAIPAFANPTGGVVVGGSATITTTPTELQISQTSNNALIEWGSFNIGTGETTRFIQPSSSAIALNRVVNSTQFSAINGNLFANGRVFIINPNGVLIGNGAQVSTAGFIASTANIANDAFMNSNGVYNFDIAGAPHASVENRGLITVQEEGLVALVAPIVRNSGVIQGNFAKIQMGAGDTFGIDLYGDGLMHIAVDSSPGAGARHLLAENSGSIMTDGGKVLMTAAAASNLVDTAINTTGVIQARGLTTKNGEIVLTGAGANIKVEGIVDASGVNGGIVKIGGDLHGQGSLAKADNLFIGANAVISADGGKSASGIGNGGKVITWANKENNFRGKITARGGQNGGNGGFVEISTAKDVLLGGLVDASAVHGLAGTFLLDPATLNIRNGSGPVIANVIYENDIQNTSVIGTNAIYAADTITLENLADNILQGGAGDITLTGTGATGKVIFNDLNDTIATTDGNLTITAGSGGITAGNLRVNGNGYLTLTTSNGGSISTRNLTVNRVTGDSAMLTVNSDGALNIFGDVLVRNVDNNDSALAANAIATLISRNNMNVTGTTTVSSYDHDQPYINSSSLLTMTSSQGNINVGGAIALDSEAEMTISPVNSYVTSKSIAKLTANNGSINLTGGITADALGVYTGSTVVDAIIELRAGGNINVNNAIRGTARAIATNNLDKSNATVSVISTGGDISFNMPGQPTAIASDAIAQQAYHGTDIDLTVTAEAGTALDTAKLFISGRRPVVPPPLPTAPLVLAPFFDIDPLGRPIISVENQVIVLDAPFEPVETLTLQTDVSIATSPEAAQLASIEPAAGEKDDEDVNKDASATTAEELARIQPAAGGSTSGAAGPNSVACANAFLDNRSCEVQ